ncbi:MAG: hydrolase [Rubinisphaera brasiliensis]|uniref:hydrolase n=1 Tax=Rubinisphaera brasiliensis TaxID=119 RepID=UPI00391D627A
MSALSASERNWIAGQKDRMLTWVERWSEINTGTFHAAGVQRLCETLAPDLSLFSGQRELLPQPGVQLVNARGDLVNHPLGPALSLRVRPHARRHVLLAIHTDTVYGIDSTFQDVRSDGEKLYGPGVADAKGGIAVLLIAAEALERYVESTGRADLGWELLLNSDEEIGSPVSSQLFHEAAARNDLALLFEPALPGGELAGNRKGSVNFEFVCRGRSAHAGRHFDEGINAVVAAADLAVKLHRLNDELSEATVNVAKIDGGGPSNMVPDVGVVRLNVRYGQHSDEAIIGELLEQSAASVAGQYGVTCERYGRFTTPPKPITDFTRPLFEQVADCGRGLGMEMEYRSTGGVCDGNRLAACGVPNVDTMGVRGGEIHSHDEYMLIDSLTERATLTADLLVGWASGERDWPLPVDAEESEG